ncbi:hypothetical protein PATY110618_08370 [Paenibacillus typhae]|uniref:Uncharacterized protein n=2 Tax=Paenibacillus typhae TaxID=1174501 RepID=A0A1G8QTM9_9BACL|nr:hypothetical protein SAMN05216192_111121 [Paenibacillus typhae]
MGNSRINGSGIPQLEKASLRCTKIYGLPLTCGINYLANEVLMIFSISYASLGKQKQLPGRGDAGPRAILQYGLEDRTMSTDQLIALLALVIMIVQLAVKKDKS